MDGKLCKHNEQKKQKSKLYLVLCVIFAIDDVTMLACEANNTTAHTMRDFTSEF
jgi:hypothetical protein